MTRFLNSVDISTRADTAAQGALIGTVTTMPAASIYNVGCTVFYAGTTGTYEMGCLYTCVQSGASYKWEKTAVLAQGLELGTADKAVITDASGKVIAAGVTSAELGYLSGVTSGLQAQLDGKVPTSRTINGKALTSDITLSATDIGAAPSSGTLAASRALQTSTNGEVEVSNVTVVELSYLSGVTSAIQDQIDGKADPSDIPTLISQLTNDSGFITNAVSDLVNYYTKDETYTRTEISNMISAIPKFSIQVVQSLPSSGISTTTIYLTPSGGGSGNSYSEYIYVNSQWELIGSTAVDLSDYYTKAQVNAMVTPVQSTSGITINGVGLQEATSGQPGLMTVAQVGQLATAVSNAQSALNGNVTSGTLSTDSSGNLSLTLNRTAGALSIGPTAITAARAVADGSGNNIASTYLPSSTAASTYATQSALTSGLAGKADAGTEITGGAFSNNTLTLQKQDGTGIDIPFEGYGNVDGAIIIGYNYISRRNLNGPTTPTAKTYTTRNVGDTKSIIQDGVFIQYIEASLSNEISSDELYYYNNSGITSTAIRDAARIGVSIKTLTVYSDVTGNFGSTWTMYNHVPITISFNNELFSISHSSLQFYSQSSSQYGGIYYYNISTT